MHPVLFEVGGITIYTYGFFIALGAVAAFSYMAWQSKREFGVTFDQSNNLFILLLAAGIVGGKLFMIFEDPSYYLSHPGRLFSGSGFVFYGSLLLCIPAMIWFFRKNKIPTLPMLDVMAIVTCIVHGFGRIGCFMAGCCYGHPTDSIFAVTFSDPLCHAKPLNTPLHPTQLYEAGFIFLLVTGLMILKARKTFDGQVFIVYLIIYACGRSIIEMFRGDLARGFVIEDILSNSQFISLIVIITAVYFYVKLKRKGKLVSIKPS
jgi:phosphatidylglycerol---prolipoprotein diacylglyceryl transferase